MLGEKVKKARRNSNITQVELAKKMNASQRTISEIEVGKRKPSLNTIERIAKALKITVQELI